MSSSSSSLESIYDVVILGAGAGGMSTAIVAAQHGLKVAILEKSPYFGGTAAFSGGVLWIPQNPLAQEAGIADSREAVETYLRHELGNGYDPEAVQLFLDKGPEMVRYFTQNTAVKFVPTLYPDYHPDAPGGAKVGRSILAAPYDIRELGAEMNRLRPPLETITFFGMMFNSSNADIAHFFKVTRSLKSALYVGKRLVKHTLELMRYRRAVQVTSGNALAGSVAKIVKLEHAWRRLDGRNDDGFQVAPFPG